MNAAQIFDSEPKRDQLPCDMMALGIKLRDRKGTGGVSNGSIDDSTLSALFALQLGSRPKVVQ